MEKIVKSKIVYLIIGAGLLMTSCGTSNDVVSGGLFSKRKYTNGYHFNFSKNIKSDDHNAVSEIKNEKQEVEIFVKESLSNEDDTLIINQNDVAESHTKNESSDIKVMKQKTTNVTKILAFSGEEKNKIISKKELVTVSYYNSNRKDQEKAHSNAKDETVNVLLHVILIIILVLIIASLLSFLGGPFGGLLSLLFLILLVLLILNVFGII